MAMFRKLPNDEAVAWWCAHCERMAATGLYPRVTDVDTRMQQGVCSVFVARINEDADDSVVMVVSPSGDALFIDWLYAYPQGVGKVGFLLPVLREIAWAAGFERVICYSDSERLVKLYKHLGFVPQGDFLVLDVGADVTEVN